MKRLRSKFIVIILLLTLLPAAIIAVLSKNLIEKALAIGSSREIVVGVNAGLRTAQQIHAQQRDRLASELRAFMRALKTLPPSKLALRDSSHVVALIDSEKRVLHRWPSNSKLTLKTFPPLGDSLQDSLIDVGSDSLAIRLAYILSNRNRLVGERPLPEALRQQLTAIQRTAQFFNIMQLEKSRLQQSLVYTFLAVYLPVLLLSFVVGWYLARRVTAPLEELGDATRRIARGDWQHRVEIRSRDEIGAMGQAFNSMVDDLKRQQQQVIGLEKMAAWRELARVLAHEIKNPLTPIQLMVQQIQDEYREQDQSYRQTLQTCSAIIDEEIEKLRKLVREFSDFARMPELNLAPAQINELIEDLARLYSKRSIKIELEPQLPITTFDWQALRRVLINLIENAHQSSPSADVFIRTCNSQKTEHIEVEIEDTGSGISKENLERIFEPYFSTKKSGMGLGLAIVKRIIEEHGGIIEVASELERGTKFTITLPKQKGATKSFG